MSSYTVLKDIVQKIESSPAIAQQSRDIEGTLLFETESEKFHLEMHGGAIQLMEGTVSSPAATVRSSESMLEQILAGKINAVQAFMSGKVKIDGDIFLVQKLVGLADKARSA